MKKISKMAALTVALLMFCGQTAASTMTVQAAGHEGLSPGTYYVDAKFFAYVNAMGGQQFGRPMLRDENESDAPSSADALKDAESYDTDKAKIVVDANGNAEMTLFFKRSAVVIYGVEAFTFIDPNPEYDGKPRPDGSTPDPSARGVKDGTIGIYDASGSSGDGGSLITGGVKYTTASSTAPNPQGNQVNYVNSITFPLPYAGDTYYLALYINSQVMGVEFCNKNDLATSMTYQSWVELDWSTASTSQPEGSSTGGGNTSGSDQNAPAPVESTSTVNMNNSGTGSSGITGTGTGSSVQQQSAPTAVTTTQEQAQAQNVTGTNTGEVLGSNRTSASGSGSNSDTGSVLGANRDTVSTGDKSRGLAAVFFTLAALMLVTVIHISGWQIKQGD